MAEAVAFSSIPPAAALPAPNPTAVREQWEGEFSRFFIFPRRHSSTVDAALRPLSMNAARHGRGTWLTASSLATICIVKDRSSNVAVLSVSVSGYIHEEHIVSGLHLTWPQVACTPQCPIRGSRVVFMSYTDCSSQIQKFAVRFPSCVDAETFINFFKDCSRDTMDIIPPAIDFMCDSSSPSEMIASNALQYRIVESESYEEAITRDMSSTAYGEDESLRPPSPPPSPLPINGINTMFSGYPPSFTELLTNCSKNPENEVTVQLENANHTLRSGESFPNLSPQNVSEQLVVLEEEINSEIARYMSDASFHDLVFKIEKVIHELGGDLSL